ncbi:DUF1203 domain-containing protein [Actinomadura rupiterrae]|uniref:DUF1203 domain-containing protein n=1 Tax=Actinomadura rupiterrae TaxID=559627 RepID=UPI0020A53A53|nr:DUF1203 domain-containing protein [Actinomadura rupiterrae]MCP2342390.1 hypothetical protein [Actinomadura rupiterrae]
MGDDAKLVFEAIPQDELDRIRTGLRDETGRPLAVQVDEEGGNPVRCCLRETEPGDRVLLIAYTPPGGSGAYAERGPVFVHAEDCGGYATPHDYPPALSYRRQVVRAYGQGGTLVEGVLVADGKEGEAVTRDLLARPDVALVQLRNVEAGCYNFAVRLA